MVVREVELMYDVLDTEIVNDIGMVSSSGVIQRFNHRNCFFRTSCFDALRPVSVISSGLNFPYF